MQFVRERNFRMSQTGTVKFFNMAKGFGFVQPDDGGKDLFVHISAVQNSGLSGLNEGDKVKFDTEKDDRGVKAVKVSLDSSEESSEE